MSKLGCSCGHVIVDQTDFLPYKAEVLSDQDSERVRGHAAAAVAAYCALRTPDERRRWIGAHFNEHYPIDLPDVAVIYDIIASGPLQYGRTVYECEACGRLWLQVRPDENRWVGYSPEDPRAEGVLRSAAEPPFVGDVGSGSDTDAAERT